MSIQQHNPPHPGALIYRTYIEPFAGMTANKIADRAGLARSTFNRLINGKGSITPTTALKLSKALGRSPQSWLNLQNSYDLWQARESVDIKSIKPIEFNQVA